MKRYLLAVTVLLAVAGCGSTAGPAGSGGAIGGPAPSADPLALVGWWQVAGTSQQVRLDPTQLEVTDGCRTFQGSWRADTDARFLAGLAGSVDTTADSSADTSAAAPADCPQAGVASTEGQVVDLSGAAPAGGLPGAPDWVGDATGYAVDGEARVLTDRSGAEVARLEPVAASGAVSVSGVDPARPATDEERQIAVPAALPPAGVAPAGPDEIVGRWRPEGLTGASESFLDLAADGTWQGSDGCNGTGGRWLAGDDGGFLANRPGLSTLIACDGVDVGAQVGAARRIGLAGTDAAPASVLVLVDVTGAAIGRFVRG